MDAIREMALDKSFGLVYAPNVTLGINVLIAILKNIAQALPSFDYQITEIHHNKKTDIPSGTAKKISKVLEDELRFIEMEDEPKIPDQFSQGGRICRVHEVMAVAIRKRITISHESFSRKAFAEGALRAAKIYCS